MPEMQGQEIGTDPLGLPGKDLKKKLTTPVIGGGVAVFIHASPPIPIHFNVFVKCLHDHRSASAIDTLGDYTYTTRIMEVCNAKEIDPNR